jgi:hypothetical protein
VKPAGGASAPAKLWYTGDFFSLGNIIKFIVPAVLDFGYRAFGLQ